MSSHHTQRCLNLHHDQVNAGRARREQRQVDRVRALLEGRQQAQAEGLCVQGFGVLCFAYTMLATATYLRFLV